MTMNQSAMPAASRRQVLKFAAGGAAAALAAPLLGGCAPGGGGGSSGGKTTLQFWDMDWGGTESSYQSAALQLIHQYEQANPDVTIDYRVLPWTTFYTIFSTAVAGGTTPDISTGATYQGFQYDSDLVPLDSVVSEWKSNGTYADLMPGSVQAQVDSAGKVTGLPWIVDCRAINYRADFLKAHGIAPPTTMAEIYNASVELGKAGKGGFGFSGDTLGYQMLCSFFFNNGGTLLDSTGAPALVNPRNIEVAEWIQDMVRHGGVPKQAPGWQNTDISSAFQNGEIAFFHGEPRNYTAWPSLGTNAAILPPPTGFHGDKGTVRWVSPIWLYKSTKNQAAATKFIVWWLANQKLLWTQGTATPLPARKSFYTLPELADPRVTLARTQWMPVGKLYSYPLPPTHWLNQFEGQSFMPTLIQDILTLKDPTASLTTAQNALKEIM
jgi:multiple sugar transport system substrate-binding protein